TTGSAGTTANTLSATRIDVFDSHGGLWVSDLTNNRILEYLPPFTNNEAASVVLGQTVFTTGTAGTTANTLSAPFGITFDSSGDLWVADDNNNRIVEF